MILTLIYLSISFVMAGYNYDRNKYFNRYTAIVESIVFGFLWPTAPFFNTGVWISRKLK